MLCQIVSNGDKWFMRCGGWGGGGKKFKMLFFLKIKYNKRFFKKYYNKKNKLTKIKTLLFSKCKQLKSNIVDYTQR